MTKPLRFLVYGYGNPGRQDDALGVMVADEVKKWATINKYSFIDIDQNYQLNIEDADRIAQYDYVIFADASVAEIESYLLEEIEPDPKADFSMHSVTPAFVVSLCNKVFSQFPNCYQLHIKGYNFKFMEEPTFEAKENLAQAIKVMKDFILKVVSEEE